MHKYQKICDIIKINMIYIDCEEFKIGCNLAFDLLQIVSDLIKPIILSEFYINNIIKEFELALDNLFNQITDHFIIEDILNYVENKLQIAKQQAIEYTVYEVCENIKKFNER
jgi:hypothetical protein